METGPPIAESLAISRPLRVMTISSLAASIKYLPKLFCSSVGADDHGHPP